MSYTDGDVYDREYIKQTEAAEIAADIALGGVTPEELREHLAPVPIFEHDRAAILHGDSTYLDGVLDEGSVDSIVCDPPAGIAFMSKGWDKDKGGRDAWIAWLTRTIAASYRALKPGGHGLVWSIPRTQHWTMTALEDAGFEIRDVVHHLFGTGFPKSLTSNSAEIPEWAGTALKPAVEAWILVRKPLAGSVAENYAEHGTGILNIGGCRAGSDEDTARKPAVVADTPSGMGKGVGGRGHDAGRWPAHLTLEHADACAESCVLGCPVRALDEQSGIKSTSKPTGKPKGKRSGGFFDTGADKGDSVPNGPQYGDKGGASRFFYVAKGARKEKDLGLDHLKPKSGGEATGREDGAAGVANPRAGAGRTGGARNPHPTVKSIALMRWLVRLVTPPGGTVLDMFAGSGSTGVAALAEGCGFIGCDMTEEYLPALVGRIRHALGMPPDITVSGTVLDPEYILAMGSAVVAAMPVDSRNNSPA